MLCFRQENRLAMSWKCSVLLPLSIVIFLPNQRNCFILNVLIQATQTTGNMKQCETENSGSTDFHFFSNQYTDCESRVQQCDKTVGLPFPKNSY